MNRQEKLQIIRDRMTKYTDEELQESIIRISTLYYNRGKYAGILLTLVIEAIVALAVLMSYII